MATTQQRKLKKLISPTASKWDTRFYAIAKEVGGWSKDPSTQVGAVIVNDRRILATGYNGIPQGITDDDRVGNREWKLATTIHAEANAIINAAKNGMGCYGSTIYVTLFPCSQCAAYIIQSGIKRVVCDGTIPQRWAASFAISKTLFDEAGVEIILIQPTITS